MAPIPNRGDKRAFFDIQINGEPAGRIVFSLWNFTCPRTVENFRTMCTGEMGELFGYDATYQRSIFHRIIKGFMIQGGDITRRNGSGGFSIYGSTFDDENLALKHNRPFLLSMANRGPDTNGSQFFITTEEVPHLDGKHCVFGEVIKGFDVVKRIENLETGENDVPVQKVQVVNCGEMVRKGEQGSPSKDDNVEPEVGGVKMEDEPRTNNWLMRRSRSPSPVGGARKIKKHKRDRSPERRRRNSRDRFGHRSRSRSIDRNRRDGRKEERRPVVSVDGVKVRGRGKLTFMGARTRSRTPPHWKREESKKQTLESHQKKLEEEEERKKRIAHRERLEAEHNARHEKERIEREAKRELDRQRIEARERRSSSRGSSLSGKSGRSPSPYQLSDPESNSGKGKGKSPSRSRSASSGKSSRRSTGSEDSD